MIPYGRQEITPADIDAVVAVLRSDYLTQGPAVPRFERAVADRVGVKHAVAVNSATSALHIACLALDLRPGDQLWTVPNTFVASANCARYCGAQVDFVDIDPYTWNMSVEALEMKLTAAERSGRLPKIVVPVHFGGQPTDQQAIFALADKFGFRIIEDASHSIGASRNDEPVGSCRFSHVTIFSFHPVKIITSGEGGMALTNDPLLAGRMELLRSHGITRVAPQFQDASARADAPGWYYEQQALGFNYRLTDLQAALGASQLEKLADYVDCRNRIATRYIEALGGLPVSWQRIEPGNRSAYHLFVVRLRDAASGARRQVYDELRNRGIGVNLHYLPVHLQPYYRELGFVPGMFPEAEAHGGSALTLPLYATLTDEQQGRVVDAVTGALRQCKLL